MSWKASISWLKATKVKLNNHKPHIKGEWETNKENVDMKGRKEKVGREKDWEKRGEVKGAHRENSGKGKRKGSKDC